MEYQPREKSYELNVFESLSHRTVLSEVHQQHLLRLQEEFAAKKKVDEYTKELRLCCSVRYDLNLMTKDGTNAQIDTLILTQETIHYYLIKNLSGSYTYRNHCFYNQEEGSLYNPRATFTLLEKCLRTMGKELNPKRKIHGHLVFPNAKFILQNEPEDYSVLTEDMLEAHFQSLIAEEIKYIYEYYQQ